ncbi:MAG: hypothetical protein WCL37_06455 [Chrysiogenales bacterium]
MEVGKTSPIVHTSSVSPGDPVNKTGFIRAPVFRQHVSEFQAAQLFQLPRRPLLLRKIFF